MITNQKCVHLTDESHLKKLQAPATGVFPGRPILALMDVSRLRHSLCMPWWTTGATQVVDASARRP